MKRTKNELIERSVEFKPNIPENLPDFKKDAGYWYEVLYLDEQLKVEKTTPAVWNGANFVFKSAYFHMGKARPLMHSDGGSNHVIKGWRKFADWEYKPEVGVEHLQEAV